MRIYLIWIRPMPVGENPADHPFIVLPRAQPEDNVLIIPA